MAKKQKFNFGSGFYSAILAKRFWNSRFSILRYSAILTIFKISINSKIPVPTTPFYIFNEVNRIFREFSENFHFFVRNLCFVVINSMQHNCNIFRTFGWVFDVHQHRFYYQEFKTLSKLYGIVSINQ